MATTLNSGTLFEFKTTATASNVNGAGFNPGNANFMTDLACDANTGNTNAPVVSSASYNFVAGDVGARVYVKSGTNWTAGFYYIASVAANKATLNASIGTAEQLNTSTGMYQPNTVAGCATVATPTGGTFGIDYSCLDAAINNATNLASTNGTTNPSVVTSATVTFASNHVGNIIHVTAGTSWTAGWYEIVSVSGGAATLSAAVGSAATLSNGTFYVGGAGILTALEDAFFENIPASSLVYFKGSGTHTLGGTMSIASTNSTTTSPSWIIGYTSIRGDGATGDNRPLIAFGANNVTWGQYQNIMNMRMTAQGSVGVRLGTGAILVNCESRNKSTTAGRFAYDTFAGDVLMINCQAYSNFGSAFNVSATRGRLIGCSARFSDIGYNISVAGCFMSKCIAESCVTNGFVTTVAATTIDNCTIYGSEAKFGIGIKLNSAANGSAIISNCILYGLTTGVAGTTTLLGSNFSYYNNYYNNTSDVSLFNKGANDLALDPTFAGMSQITGTTASGSASTLTDTNADFSTVEDNADYVYVASGTGATVGFFQITSHTSTTLVCDNTVGTNATANRVYTVFKGHNLGIGTNLKAQGFPGTYYNGNSTDVPISYLDIGAVQRQEPASSGSTGFFIS